MEKFTGMSEAWYEKLIVSFLLGIFAPFRVSLVVLFVLILIDTITGVAYVLKIKSFSSKGFRKGVIKMITYFTSILVVRLCEIGISDLVSTTYLTKIMTSYLVVTETLSILENLARLGAPLPAGLMKFIMKQLDGNRLKMLGGNGSGEAYVKDLQDIINYQIPNIKSPIMRKILDIKYNEWGLLINLIDTNLDENKYASNELLYYKVKSLSDSTRARIRERWKEEEIPSACINCYGKWIKHRLDEWEDTMWAICKSEVPMEEKKKLLIDKAIISLYKSIVDIQKGDNSFCGQECKDCKNCEK